MSDTVLNKLAFNGYNVTFLNHEGREIEEDNLRTLADLTRRGYESNEVPTVEDLVEDCYRIFGDTVGKVVDNYGVVLYDNMKEMNDEHNDPMFD